MAELSLAELVREGLARDVVGDPAAIVSGVRHDSRAVEPGDLFVAIRGQVFDGQDYSRDAVARGASAVASEAPLSLSVPILLVDDALAALWRLSQRVYADPTASLCTIGVTGTNGKTTVAYLVEQMLSGLGEAPAVVGTVENRGPGGTLPATHTTPMADDLMRLAVWARDSGASHLVLEVSSHALAMQRVDGVRFRLAAFTNLTQDHLDYHGDMASYAAAKGRLFRELSPEAAVLNVDDPHGRALAESFPRRCLRCARAPRDGADVFAVEHRVGRAGITARVQTPFGEVQLESPLFGTHNLDNLLLALGCGIALGFEADRVAAALAQATGAPGRLQSIAHPADVLVFVDYAHTPDALSRVCRAVRDVTDGRLLVVFGCGGDRDRAKRPLMGEAVGRQAQLAIVTSDNPRGEAPDAIIADILPGLTRSGCPRLSPEALSSAAAGYTTIVDRRAAIAAAIGAAGPGDAVLIAGKGHETYQQIGDQRLAFDDREEARRAIASLSGGA